jgi:hypothetical protein
MTRLMQCSLAVVIALRLFANAQAQEKPFAAPDPEQFAILPWDSAPGDKAALEDIKACGFNLAGFAPIDHLDAVAAVGLKAFVQMPEINVDDANAALDEGKIAERIKAVVDKVGTNPAVFGYCFRDEPSAAVFNGLGKWSKALRTAAPKSRAYINLFPNYANSAQLGTSTYEQYLEQFVKTVNPAFISYDHYALMADGSLRDGYFQNLEAVRACAQRHNLPFWNIVLGNSHFDYAEPSNGGLNFQMYTTLAYGARGISYFTYRTPLVGNYRLAAIDQFGHKTPTWDMLRRVNLQIHRLAPTYLTLKNVNVFHHPNVPQACRGSDSSRMLVALEGRDLMAGEFEGPKGWPYVLVVNKDMHRSTPFGIRFKTPGTIKMVSSWTGEVVDFGGEQGWLAPGQGMLLFVEPGK